MENKNGKYERKSREKCQEQRIENFSRILFLTVELTASKQG